MAAEVRRVRENIPRATVGIVYDDGDTTLTAAALEQLRENLEDRLQGDLVPVRLVPRNDGVGQINQFDCAKIVSVLQTKGLEFDGVVLVDSTGRWMGADGKAASVLRNRLYVAASRAKQALSIIAPRTEIIRTLMATKLCELAQL
ncbi:MAG: ATP-binding domain-containing protein [Planctomycetes bacterium]|nr:ATP-binding domain-containing protein [Planctomycetota bacterium]